MSLKKKPKQGGYTMVEVAIAAVVMAVLATLTMPRMYATIERNRTQEGVQILHALYGSQKRFFLDNGVYSNVANTLDTAIGARATKNGVSIFQPPTVSNDINRIARIVRTGGGYTLDITAAGTINCIDGTIDCTDIGF